MALGPRARPQGCSFHGDGQVIGMEVVTTTAAWEFSGNFLVIGNRRGSGLGAGQLLQSIGAARHRLRA